MLKVSSEMYPLNELREEYYKRITSTGFFNPRPNVVVSFKLFSHIVSSMGNASEYYSEVVEKALSETSFLTMDGMHQLKEVDYMFIDSDNLCTAVLKDESVLTLMEPGLGSVRKPIVGDPEDDVKVSTYKLKEFYMEHREEFPYLNSMAEEIESMGIAHSMVSTNTPVAARKCKGNEWINSNINYCIEELQYLLSKASFVLVGRRSKKPFPIR